MTTFKVIRQYWIESERGWGIRPDGYTLHLTLLDRKQFVAAYWARMPDEVPDEYSRPDGPSETIDVDEATYIEVKNSISGIWRIR